MPKYLFTMDRTCRVCTKETEGIFIYSDIGKEMQIENKIKRYLYLQVAETDPFPKTICKECLQILKAIDELAEIAATSQAKLSSCLNTKCINFKEQWICQDIEEPSDSEPELEKEKTKPSLLHSILTKNQNSNDVTEMEVNIDPSLFFEEESLDKNDSKSDELENDETSKNDTEVKPYQCSLCPRGFNTDLSLKNHLWNHLPSRKFLTSADLNRFQLHPVYKNKISDTQCLCQVCGRIYPTKSTLRAHQITHSNLRPHKCTLCEKTFKRNQDLKFHINQHTGERPYRCPYCPKAFASSGNCFSHRKRMHPKQLARDKKRVLH